MNLEFKIAVCPVCCAFYCVGKDAYRIGHMGQSGPRNPNDFLGWWTCGHVDIGEHYVAVNQDGKTILASRVQR